jgi:hypothetical protein
MYLANKFANGFDAQGRADQDVVAFAEDQLARNGRYSDWVVAEVPDGATDWGVHEEYVDEGVPFCDVLWYVLDGKLHTVYADASVAVGK